MEIIHRFNYPDCENQEACFRRGELLCTKCYPMRKWQYLVKAGERVRVIVYNSLGGDWELYEGTLVQIVDETEGFFIKLDQPAVYPGYWNRENYPPGEYYLYRTIGTFVYPIDAYICKSRREGGELVWYEVPGVEYSGVGPWNLLEAHQRNELLPKSKDKKTYKLSKTTYAE